VGFIVMGLCRSAYQGLEAAAHALLRINPKVRDRFDALFRAPLEAITQYSINFGRRDDHLEIAEERLLLGEAALAEEITRYMTDFLNSHYLRGGYLRAGNTKTHGVVGAKFDVLPELRPELAVGLFAEPRSYPAWVRFGGPGPLAPPDADDNGLLSVGIKVMGVPGPKLLDDERQTQDFVGISAPTFTTPNVKANLQLQRQVGRGTPLFYFLNPFDSHIGDMIMQGLYSKLNTSPLEVRYFSCVPYLYGDNKAIQYSIKPCSAERTPVPSPPGPEYLRDAMVDRLAKSDWEFDFMVQFQSDAHRMPIENASVRWPESLSPYELVAKLRIPKQRFDYPAQFAFAGNLSFNAWHCVAEHRPLGNLNRARRHIYYTLSRLRQDMNGQPHIEPTGSELFN
jgi:hypothetical protein